MAQAMAVAESLLLQPDGTPRLLTEGEGYKQPLGTTNMSYLYGVWLERNYKDRGKVVAPGPWFRRSSAAGRSISCSGLYLVMEKAVPPSHTHLSVLPMAPGTFLADDGSTGPGSGYRHGQLLPPLDQQQQQPAARFTVAVYGSLAGEPETSDEDEQNKTFDSDLSRNAAYMHRNSPLMRLCCTTAALSAMGGARKTLIVENAVWCNEELQGTYMADMAPILTRMKTERSIPDDDEDTWFSGDHMESLTPAQSHTSIWVITQRNILQMVQRELMLVAFLANMDFVQMAWNLHEPAGGDIHIGQVFFPPATGGGEVTEDDQEMLLGREISAMPVLARNAWVFTNERYAAQVAYVSTMFHGLQDSFKQTRPAEDDMELLQMVTLDLQYLTYRGQGTKLVIMQGTELFDTSAASELQDLISGIEAFGVIIPYRHLEKMGVASTAELARLGQGFPPRSGIAMLSDIQVDLCENLLRAVTAAGRPLGRLTEIRVLPGQCDILVAGKPVARIGWVIKYTDKAKVEYSGQYRIAFGNDSDSRMTIMPDGERAEVVQQTLIIKSVFVSPEFRNRGFFGQLMCVAYRFAATLRANVLYNVWQGGTVLQALRTIPHIQQSEALWLKTLFPPLPANTGPAAAAAAAVDARDWNAKLDDVLTRALNSFQSCREVAERKPHDMNADFFETQSKATFRAAKQSSFVRMMAHMAFLYNFGVFKAIKSTKATPDLILLEGSSVIIFVSSDVVQQCIDALLPPVPLSLPTSSGALCTTCAACPALYHSRQQYLCAKDDCAVDAAALQILATHGLEQWM